MRETDTARAAARHLGAAEALAARGEATLAGGAVHLAIVTMLRLAATPAGTPVEHATVVAGLRDAVARLSDPLRRRHIAALIEAAFASEAMRRLRAGLPSHDGRLGGWMDGIVVPPSSDDEAPLGLDALTPSDLDGYGTAASAADVDVVLTGCRMALRDVIAVRKAGRDVGEAWATFETSAFGLCIAPAASHAARLDARRTLLILWGALRRRRPLAAVVLRQQLVIDRALWPGPVR